MKASTIGFLAALFGMLSVALGAFGAHGLQGRLSPADMAIFETAVRYQFFHALALMVPALRMERTRNGFLELAAWSFLAGIVLFSGSLYVLVGSGQRWLGAVTPLGGVSFIVGWCALAWSFLRLSPEDAKDAMNSPTEGGAP